MKIKTITTWADYNYGASLQAYALLAFLKNKGHEVELIHYLPPYQTRMYDYMWVNPESKASRFLITRWAYRGAKFLQRMTTLRRKRIFDEFNFHSLPLSSEVYHSFDEIRRNPPEADVYICGSDQIWNVLYDAGKDPTFFLEFVPKGHKKVSYAASFSYLNIDETNRRRIANSLQKFEAVSVREYQGIELLKDMGIDGTWVLDPVFLLPIEHWNSFSAKAKVDIGKEPYLLVYDFEGNRQLKDAAIGYAKQHQLKIYSITDKRPLAYTHRNFNNVGPMEFVKMIAGCSAFMSNSFHGTAFSIMYHKPFYVFNRQRHSVNSRMESLLTLFGLKDRLIIGKESVESDIDWKNVERIKNAYLTQSLDFLKKIGV